MSSLRRLRRCGKIGEFISVSTQHDTVQIASDGGRVCRPLIICDKGIPRVQKYHLEAIKTQNWTFIDFLRNGLVEYLGMYLEKRPFSGILLVETVLILYATESIS
jgi:DNA-directed RNA polymerase III subunit RPC2